MKIKINKKSLFKVFAGFIGVLVCAYSYFFIYSKIKFLSTETGSAVRAISVFDEKGEGFVIAKSNLENQNENVKTLEEAFFSESQFVNLLNVFENIAKKAEVKFKAQQANLPQGGGNATISFTLDGSFNSIGKFMILLDNMRYSSMVNKFSITKGDDVLTANVDYLIFNYK